MNETLFPVNSDLGFCLGEVVQEVQILPVGFCFSWVLLLEEYLSVNFCSCYVLSHEPSRTAGLTSVMPRILQFCSIICYRFLYYLMLNPYLFLLFLFFFFIFWCGLVRMCDVGGSDAGLQLPRPVLSC